ncbi:OmpP1/FadL family transporter [Sunxiuqinia sp. A32]|uniref:OmpP1/FadL family transporter n=1 Tax=Sunxiuqinia sp. A32 TaxID=3461496 RepID=UPI0040459704
MKSIFLRRILFIIFTLGALTFSARATDGYFSTGYGTISKSLAGAGVAYYQASLINGNPAGMALLGKKFHIGVDLFNPNRDFTIMNDPSGFDGTFGLQAGSVESGAKYFVIPSLGANFMLTDYSSFGVALYGNGGMNTTFPPGGFGDFGSEYTGVELIQMFSNFTYSLNIDKQHSIGVTGILAYQYFQADGLAAFAVFSSDVTKLSGNGRSNSFGYGIKVGYLGQLTDLITVGASYQSKTYMSEFKEYAGLIAEKGDFDVPANWTVGVALHMTDEWTLMADFKQINYADVKSISNQMMGPNGINAPLGAASGAGFGWDNMSLIKVGFAYESPSSWTVRGGYSFGNSPISDKDVMFNILAPAVITNQAAIGFTKNLEKKKRRGRGWKGYRGRKKTGEGKQLHLAFNYAFPNSVKGINPMDTYSSPPQTIEIGMNQMELEIGFSF